MNILNHEKDVGLIDRLKKDNLIVKLGFDPTSPDLHLGHYVVLKGAKKLQDMGHQIIIIVGDFTAAIGDPSGRNKLRPPLSEESILENAKTYMEQVFMVLDESKTIVKRNSEWLKKLDIKDMLSLLSNVTLSQMLVRDDFRNRFEAQTPIFMHEMVYPLMQGLDSVAIKADIELGGTDQTFNLMMGRELQKVNKQLEQAVVTFPLLVGLDGKKKMSKSLNNHIGLKDSPQDKFGKIMSLSDETMWNYWKVLLDKTEEELEKMQQSGDNPKNIKLELATQVVALFHGLDIANIEKEKFNNLFSKKNLENIPNVEVFIDNVEILLSHLIKKLDFATSISDANRKIEQKGVRINQNVVEDKYFKIKQGDEFILQVGKLNMKKVKLK